jgi:hypothetical protein
LHENDARALFHSLRRLKALPDYLELLPGAYSGWACGGSLSGKPVSTTGFERRRNPAFWIEDEVEFERFMLKDIAAPPPHAAKLRPADAGNSMAPA